MVSLLFSCIVLYARHHLLVWHSDVNTLNCHLHFNTFVSYYAIIIPDNTLYIIPVREGLLIFILLIIVDVVSAGILAEVENNEDHYS